MSISKRVINPLFQYTVNFDSDIIETRATTDRYDMAKENFRKVFEDEVEFLSHFLTIDNIKLLINYLIGVYEGAYAVQGDIDDVEDRNTLIDDITFDYSMSKDSITVSFKSYKDVKV